MIPKFIILGGGFWALREKSQKTCFFFFLKILEMFYTYLFVCLCLCVHAMVCMEMSENNLWDFVLSFVCVGFHYQTQGLQQALHPESLASQYFTLLCHHFVLCDIMSLLISGRAWCIPGWPWTCGVALVLEPLMPWPPSPKGSDTPQPAPSLPVFWGAVNTVLPIQEQKNTLSPTCLHLPPAL